jgi:hypothetical protein|nr:MAG TPA: hypothetical protein [Caudoviricetes sp.]
MVRELSKKYNLWSSPTEFIGWLVDGLKGVPKKVNYDSNSIEPILEIVYNDNAVIPISNDKINGIELTFPIFRSYDYEALAKEHNLLYSKDNVDILAKSYPLMENYCLLELNRSIIPIEAIFSKHRAYWLYEICKALNKD